MSELTDILEALHTDVAKLLAERIKDKSATASEIAQAINLLKHNNIQEVIKPDSPLGNLLKQIPEFKEETLQ